MQEKGVREIVDCGFKKAYLFGLLFTVHSSPFKGVNNYEWSTLWQERVLQMLCHHLQVKALAAKSDVIIVKNHGNRGVDRSK